jgi:hypothetical protein
MITCPRCGANNESDRAACWNCYAPLTGALAARVKPMVLTGHGGAVEAVAEPSDNGGVPPPPEPPKKRGLFGKK